MSRTRFLILALALLAAAGTAGHALAQTGGKKQCGGRDGAGKAVANAACAKDRCIANCKVTATVNFMVCEQAGGTCMDTVVTVCAGNGYTGTNCSGTVYGACQIEIPSCK